MANSVKSIDGWLSQAIVLSGTSDFSIVWAQYLTDPSVAGVYQVPVSLHNTVAFFLIVRIPPDDTPPDSSVAIFKASPFSGNSATVAADSVTLGHWVHYAFVWHAAGGGSAELYAVLEGFNPASPAYLLTPSLGTVVMTDHLGDHPSTLDVWKGSSIAVNAAQAGLKFAQVALTEAQVLAQFAQRAPISAVTAVSYTYLALTDAANPEVDSGSTATNFSKTGTFSSFNSEPSDWVIIPPPPTDVVIPDLSSPAQFICGFGF